METSTFSEWQFVIQELKERNEETYDFAYQKKLLKEFQKQVMAGIEILRQEIKDVIGDRESSIAREIRTQQ